MLPQVAKVSLAATRAFGMPANSNVYLTSCGVEQPTSGFPHQDRQDIFIIHLKGWKHTHLAHNHNPNPNPNPNANPNRNLTPNDVDPDTKPDLHPNLNPLPN